MDGILFVTLPDWRAAYLQQVSVRQCLLSTTLAQGSYNAVLRSDLCGHCLRSAPGTASPSVYKMRLRARTLTDQIKSESSQSSAIE